MEEKELSKIFISHRSTDKAIADAIFDFFVATGIHLMFDKIIIEEMDDGLNLDLRLKSPFISKKK